jgi:hypothetical protein
MFAMRKLPLWISWALLIFVTANVNADELPVSAQSQVAAQSQKARDEKSSSPEISELDAILEAWHAANVRVRRLDAKFDRTAYDLEFNRQMLGKGSFALDDLGRAIYKCSPCEIPHGTTARRNAETGKPFQLSSCGFAEWCWTGKSIIHVDRSDQSYSEIELSSERTTSGRLRKQEQDKELPDAPPLPEGGPSKISWQSIAWRSAASGSSELVDSTTPKKLTAHDSAPEHWMSIQSVPVMIFSTTIWLRVNSSARNSDTSQSLSAWPHIRLQIIDTEFWLDLLLLGKSVDDLKTRFEVTLVRQDWREIRLKLIPKLPQDRNVYSEVQMILKTDGYQLYAIKLIGPTKKSWDVYTFSELRFNLPANEGIRDLTRPNLRGLKKAVGRLK